MNREENIETREYGKEYFQESDKGKFYNSNCEPELRNILQSGSRESRKKNLWEIKGKEGHLMCLGVIEIISRHQSP